MYQPLAPEEQGQYQTYFAQVLSAARAHTTGSLPFFHTCRGKNFRGIFAARQLSPTHCKEFNEQLLYLFYGRPAYRVSDKGKTSKDAGQFPVCLILSSPPAAAIKRIFPFDTGALLHKVFDDICGEESNPAKYQIGTSIDEMRRFIHFFYGSDKNYFSATPTATSADLPAFSFELQHVLSMINESSAKEWDNRAYTIEAQCVSTIPLSSSCVSAVIMPASYLNSTDVADYFYNNSIHPITYSLDRANPTHITTLITSLVEQHLTSVGLL